MTKVDHCACIKLFFGHILFIPSAFEEPFNSRENMKEILRTEYRE